MPSWGRAPEATARSNAALTRYNDTVNAINQLARPDEGAPLPAHPGTFRSCTSSFARPARDNPRYAARPLQAPRFPCGICFLDLAASCSPAVPFGCDYFCG